MKKEEELVMGGYLVTVNKEKVLCRFKSVPCPLIRVAIDVESLIQ